MADIDDDLFDDELLEDDAEATSPSSSNQPQAEPSSAPAEPVYADVYEFVENFLKHIVQRKVNSGQGLKWDPEWYKYTEVVYRLSALHRSWEVAYRSDDQSEMARWLLQFCDPMMAQIMNGDHGPFYRFDPDGASLPPGGLEVRPAPRH